MIREEENPFQAPEEQCLFTEVVFLIGNGTSRENFDLNRLRGFGTIIGCNALYRDFYPDILISVDTKMVLEIKESDFPKERLLMPHKRSVVIPGAKYWKTHSFNTSGSFALQFIGKVLKPKRCYMLGMDAYIGNVYSMSNNYGRQNITNWQGVLKNYGLALGMCSEVDIINVNFKNAWTPEMLGKEYPNYSMLSYPDFESKLNNNEL